MLDSTMKEPHYKVDEVAIMWSMSKDSVRRMFMNELGVVRYSRPRKKYKRGYTTLLIPESVLDRVYRSMKVVE
jgi:hypothetical protein